MSTVVESLERAQLRGTRGRGLWSVVAVILTAMSPLLLTSAALARPHRAPRGSAQQLLQHAVSSGALVAEPTN